MIDTGRAAGKEVSDVQLIALRAVHMPLLFHGLQEEQTGTAGMQEERRHGPGARKRKNHED